MVTSASSDSALSSTLSTTAINPQLHVDTYNMIRKAFPSNPIPVNQMLQLVSLAESSYGKGWKKEGVGSHNMGAITGTGPAGFFTTGDSRYDATKGGVVGYTTKFKKYHSDLEGIQDLAVTLLKPNVRAALNTNKLLAGVTAQYGNGYFTGVQKLPEDNVRHYWHFLAQWIPAVAAATGEHSSFTDLDHVPTADEVRAIWGILSGQGSKGVVHGGGLRNLAPLPIGPAGVQQVAASSPPVVGEPRHFIMIEGDPGKLQALASTVKQSGLPGVVATSTFVPGHGWADWNKHS
jgi:hypothetical protein